MSHILLAKSISAFKPKNKRVKYLMKESGRILLWVQKTPEMLIYVPNSHHSLRSSK